MAQFRNGKLQGDQITFSVIEYAGTGAVQRDFVGRVKGDAIEGVAKSASGGAEEKWTAKRVVN